MFSEIVAGTVAPASVASVGKYLKKNIDGSYKMTFGPNLCTVYFTMFFQDEYGGPIKEMNFAIDLTSYQNKVRVNITELTKNQKTICQVIFNEDDLKDLREAKKKMLTKLAQAIEKEYEGFELVY